MTKCASQPRLICMDGLTKPLFLGRLRHVIIWSVSRLEALPGGTSSPSIYPRPQWAGPIVPLFYRNAECLHVFIKLLNEPRHEKTGHRLRETKTQISFAVTAKLISAFVFASRIVQFLLYLYPKSQDSNFLLRLYRSVCVARDRNSRKPVSHVAAHFSNIM